MDSEQNTQFGAGGAFQTSPSATQPGAGGIGQQAREKASQVASDVQHKAGEQVRAGVTAAKSRAAGTLNGVAESLRISTQQLRETQPDGPVEYVERVGDQVQRLADYLQNTEPREMLTQVESFARRQPALFLGGVFALGVLGARFLKSSQREGGTDRYDQGTNPPPRLYDREYPLAGTQSSSGRTADTGWAM